MIITVFIDLDILFFDLRNTKYSIHFFPGERRMDFYVPKLYVILFNVDLIYHVISPEIVMCMT